MSVVGIDPGLDGGIAWLPEPVLSGQRAIRPLVWLMPTLRAKTGRVLDVEEIVRLALRIEDELRPEMNLVVIEAISGFRAEAARMSSQMKLAQQIGWWRGYWRARDVPVEAVHPARWHRIMIGPGKLGKDDAIRKAGELFPGVDLRRTPKCRKAHDGLADALLLAEYGRRLVHA